LHEEKSQEMVPVLIKMKQANKHDGVHGDGKKKLKAQRVDKGKALHDGMGDTLSQPFPYDGVFPERCLLYDSSPFLRVIRGSSTHSKPRHGMLCARPLNQPSSGHRRR
jgi:hypothetical protein